VPNLILQPIVENAIKHGIVSRIAPGEIEISAKRVGESLALEVKDNGPGLHRARSSGLVKEGLGLGNTRARLEQLYGASHHFDMTDAPEGGLKVTLDIPFEVARARERAAII
jgi:sensor histidine kinase YesM